MYLQITTRCNMLCAHCCFRCTSRGTDMSRDTFLAASRFASDHGMTITIGGGEPTVHPLLFDFIGIAAAHSDEERVPHVITNGKKKREALQLARLAQIGAVSAELSRDKYHELVDTRVIDRFRELGSTRNNFRILKAGRALDNQIYTEDDDDNCPCDDLFVSPNGKLWQCAHKAKQLGTVFEPGNLPENVWDGCCSKAKRERYQ